MSPLSEDIQLLGFWWLPFRAFSFCALAESLREDVEERVGRHCLLHFPAARVLALECFYSFRPNKECALFLECVIDR